MSPSHTTDVDAAWDRAGATWPAWLLSLTLHAALFLLLTAGVNLAPPAAPSEPGREVGIVLASRDESEQETFLDQAEAASAQTGAQTAEPLFDIALPQDPAESLPRPQDWLGAAAAQPGLATSAAGMARGPAGPGRASDGNARTSLFGVAGVGQKFVYVFDRSGSMGGSGRSALAAAKEELLASLQPLESTHQFQIIFYNDEPSLFQIPGRAGQLVFGDDASKQAADAFVRKIRADGATDHLRALSLALKLQPDVIYFLTDADQPVMSSAQLARVQRINSGQTTIHAIEFGFGPPLAGENFLMQLAAQNGGTHRYVDVAQLGVTR